jgi:NAD(P)-dependent dehydrogenase (short-subunit alcohol dehydrogenase family)
MPALNMTAIVTGGGSQRGIGRATAHALAGAGWHVAVLDLGEAGPRRRQQRSPSGTGHRPWVCAVT